MNETAARLLDDYSVHLPRWQQLDPIGRLRSAQSDAELLAIFASLGDRHTHCALPTPIAAWLPFNVASCNDGVFITASLIDDLKRGDRIVRWNNVPMTTTLRELMPLHLGANRYARAAKAVQMLALRPLSILPEPAESRVVLELYGGKRVELAWQFEELQTLGAKIAPLFDSDASNISVRDRVIRIRSFREAPQPFLQRFLDALSSVPQDGVILDLRGCEEGIIQTAEQLLQLFTTQRIEPERFRFRVTPAIRALADRSLHDWRDAVHRTRGIYSHAQTITTVDEANAIGRRYPGPLLVLVDALTYSSAEMFAAGVQDHGIGKVVGVAPRTGGGGASAWSQSAIAELTGNDALRPRASEPSLRIAVRCAERVLRNRGKEIEGCGVTPDVVHAPTHSDVLADDKDLHFRLLAELLNQR
ncbi:MAG TPA: S41 family peptidase [Thermoanaerobaculia bacterium]